MFGTPNTDIDAGLMTLAKEQNLPFDFKTLLDYSNVITKAESLDALNAVCAQLSLSTSTSVDEGGGWMQQSVEYFSNLSAELLSTVCGMFSARSSASATTSRSTSSSPRSSAPSSPARNNQTSSLLQHQLDYLNGCASVRRAFLADKIKEDYPDFPTNTVSIDFNKS